MKQEYTQLSVEDVEFDTDNPRIKKALDKYGDKITAERISFALRSADEGASTSSFNQLKDSIRANKGIVQPITVNFTSGKYVCLDGNTRLAIYKDFLKSTNESNWNKISALVVRDAKKRDIETIRMSAHLVGAREWPAYEKARYLHYLYHSEFMEYGEMIALCGGNKADIQRQIDAFDDMNEYYRDVVNDSEFDIARFSGFVELQKPKTKEAIFEAGYSLADFGEWIKKGNIRRLEPIRQLPRVLQDKEATDIFVNGGVSSLDEAIKLVDRKTEDARQSNGGKVDVSNASIQLLAETLTRKISDLPFADLQALQEEGNTAIDQVGVLDGLVDSINQLLSHVRK